MVWGPINVFGLLNGEVVHCEVTVHTHNRLRCASLQYKVIRADIVNAAFKEYGVNEDALLKYVEEHYPKVVCGI